MHDDHRGGAAAAPMESVATRTEAQERLPIPQAALVVVSLSLLCWAAIGVGIHWLLT